MQFPFYIIHILDSLVTYTAGDGADGLIPESALDYPDPEIIKQDTTGHVLQDPNIMTACHITDNAAHIDTLEADPKYFVLGTEVVVKNEAL